MDKEAPPDLELHQYVDGILDEQAMERVEAYLERNPDVAARVRDYLRQKTDIRAFADRALAGRDVNQFAALEKQLARRLKRRRFLGTPNLAAMALLVVAGWIGHVVYSEVVLGPGYVEQIVQAHFLSSTDPTEIQGLSPERISRLFARIGENGRLPDLRAFGYEPIGAQLVPSDAGIMLHVPYRSAQGAFMSYFLLHNEEEDEIAPHIVRRDGLTLAYWQHDHSRHAIAAPLPDPDVESIAAFLEASSTVVDF